MTQFKILFWFILLSSVSTFCFIILCSFYPQFWQDKFTTHYVFAELGQSLSDFGKAVKLLGASEGNALGKAFSELGMKSEILSVKLQKEVILTCLLLDIIVLVIRMFAWRYMPIIDRSNWNKLSYYDRPISSWWILKNHWRIMSVLYNLLR